MDQIFLSNLKLENELLNSSSREVAHSVRAICEEFTWVDSVLVACLLGQYNKDTTAVVNLLRKYSPLSEIERNLEKSMVEGNGIGLESLPLELLELIAKQLSTKDLVACSATCKSWRNAFNYDSFWINRCNHEVANHLGQLDCVVQPAFMYKQVEGSQLRPVCDWRLNLMRETHLWNNWRSGSFLWAKIETAKVIEAILSYKYFSFYKEEFVISMCNNEVGVWDVRGEPIRYFSQSPCLETWPRICFCHVSGKQLVLVQKALVQVFRINLMKETWLPEQVFFFDDTNSKEMTLSDYLWGGGRESSASECYVVGKYFFGIVNDRKNTMHVWNLRKGRKIGQVRNESWNFVDVKSATNTDVAMISVRKGINSVHLLVFSLTDHTFYPLSVKNPKYCDLHEDRMVVLTESASKWLIYNYKTGELLFKVPIQSRYFTGPFELFGNKLLSISQYKINQLDLSTGKTEEWMSFDELVYDFKILANRFISLKLKLSDDGCLRDVQSWNKDGGLATEIWEITKPPRKLKLQLDGVPSAHDIKMNKSCSKMILKQSDLSICIINLW